MSDPGSIFRFHWRCVGAVVLVAALNSSTIALGADSVLGHPARPVDAAVVAGPTKPAAPAVPQSKIESQPIGGGKSADAAAPASTEHSQEFGVGRVVLSLAVVVGLILLLRLAGKRLFPMSSPNRSTRAVQILARTPIAPRREILLLRVGRRVIVVGETGAGMNPLCEISDPDEVAALIGQIQAERTDSASHTFGKLFHRAAQEMSGEEAADEMETQTPEMPDPSTAETAVDPIISDARDELTGLSERIRGLARLVPRS